MVHVVEVVEEVVVVAQVVVEVVVASVWRYCMTKIGYIIS